MHGYSKKEYAKRSKVDGINSTTFDFYCLLPIIVNQDKVVRALPANCCARRAPYFYGAFCWNDDDFKSAAFLWSAP
jgi:hypothetical protein